MEKWKEIDGYEDYKISSKGRIKSFKRSEPKILTCWDVRGYKYVRLCKDGKSSPKRVSRLVALHFIPNPDNKPQVNHINGLNDDNRAENLEWCTASENLLHASENGLLNPTKGEDNYWAKLTKNDVFEIKRIYKETDLSQYEIAEMYGVNQSQISRCTSGQTWYEG